MSVGLSLSGKGSGRIPPYRRWAVFATAAVCASVVQPTHGQSLDDQTLDRVKKATVMVRTSYSKNREGDTLYGSGSGFFVNTTGLCISNNHVVDPGHHKSEDEKFKLKHDLNRLVWTVVTDSGTDQEKEWRGDVLYQNEQADLAVIQVKNEEGEFLDTPHFLRFYPTADVTPGLKAWCLGFPGGDARKNEKEFPPIAVSAGNIVALPRSASGRLRMIETDVLANPGNSGGPFVDQSGRLIGVLTLGSQTEARTNTTMLIPGDLVQKMILTAFRRGKVANGVDLAPFYDLFPTKERIWKLPQLDRVPDRDCLTLVTGSRICGEMTDKILTWPTPLGDIKVPRSAMAYVRGEGERAMAFLDGGDRFLVRRAEATIKFTPDGGSPIPIKLDEVQMISFRLPAGPPDVPMGETYVIGGRDFHLSLKDVSGGVKIENELLGELSLPAADVERIETEDTDRVIYAVTGSHLSGRVQRHTLNAKLAWCGSPIEFSYKDIESMEVRRVNYAQQVTAGEIDLAQSLETGDPRLVRIADRLDADDVAAAGPLLDELLAEDAFRALSDEKKEQVRFLEGEYLLRSGKLNEAAEIFKKLRRAKVENVLWHSRSRLAILERFTEGTFENGPLSDADVFHRAARSLAGELTREASHTIDGIEKSRLDTRGTYLKLLKRSEEAEEQLQIANRLTGGESEEYLVYLWRITGRVHGQEARRLAEQRESLQAQLAGPGPGGRELSDYQRRRINDKIAQVERDVEMAQEDYVAVRGKILNAGFLIDDPDLITGAAK